MSHPVQGRFIALQWIPCLAINSIDDQYLAKQIPINSSSSEDICVFVTIKFTYEGHVEKWIVTTVINLLFASAQGKNDVSIFCSRRPLRQNHFNSLSKYN